MPRTPQSHSRAAQSAQTSREFSFSDTEEDAVVVDNCSSKTDTQRELLTRFFYTGKAGEEIVRQKGEYFEQLLQITALFLTIDAVWPSESKCTCHRVAVCNHLYILCNHLIHIFSAPSSAL